KPIIEIETANDIDTLKKNLINKFPLLNNYSFQFAVNKEKTEKNTLLNENDEVALLPPFAGG
ncbi:MAG TPA: MoaD/ThiS family protein, partial [Bacteroidia bacterium]|nr:MoaD/ThiS family protein [Bacteroidia bacterium]